MVVEQFKGEVDAVELGRKDTGAFHQAAGVRYVELWN